MKAESINQYTVRYDDTCKMSMDVWAATTADDAPTLRVLTLLHLGGGL
jgi:hypothetical protein